MANEENERLSALVAVVDGMHSDALAINVLLRALIETHPDRAQLAKAMERHLTDQLSQLRDAAFERGKPTGFARGMTDDAAEKAEGWLREVRGS